MAGSGGKGKISHDLVAVSCAAVLAVYAAGYWRTRDAARRLETQALERRPARAALPAAPASRPPSQPAAPALAPTEVTPAISAPPVPSPPVAAAPPPSPAITATATTPPATPAPPPSAAAAASTVAPLVETSSPAVAVATPAEPVPVAAVPESPPVPAANWRDGTFTGWGSSRHGDIKAQVVIRGGRIVESSVASCETRWPCDVISTIFNQPVERQSAEVDRVSRATESTNAYYYALVDALDEALVIPPPAQTSAR